MAAQGSKKLADQGFSLELVLPCFYLIVLVKVSHRASPCGREQHKGGVIHWEPSLETSYHIQEVALLNEVVAVFKCKS